MVQSKLNMMQKDYKYLELQKRAGNKNTHNIRSIPWPSFIRSDLNFIDDSSQFIHWDSFMLPFFRNVTIFHL